MFKKIFESCEDSIVRRVSNPYFGTYILVFFIDNWQLFYTLFSFSQDETRADRIAIITDYINQAGGLSWLFGKCALVAFAPFIIYYLLLNISGYISNNFELRVKPWLLKKVDNGLVVDKVEYDNLLNQYGELQTKFDKERKERVQAEAERDKSTKTLMMSQVNKQDTTKDETNSISVIDNIEYSATKLTKYFESHYRDSFKKLIYAIRNNQSITAELTTIYKEAITYNIVEVDTVDEEIRFTKLGNQVVEKFLLNTLNWHSPTI